MTFKFGPLEFTHGTSFNDEPHGLVFKDVQFTKDIPDIDSGVRWKEVIFDFENSEILLYRGDNMGNAYIVSHKFKMDISLSLIE